MSYINISTMQTLNLQNKIRIIAIVLMMITALNALAAGFSFIVDPSGNGLGMSPAYLRHSPFDDFFIPGLTLFIFNGVLNLFSAFVAIRKGKDYELLILFQGCILSGWIVIQLMMLQFFHVLHVIMGLTGASLIIIGILLFKRTRLRKL